MTPFPEAVGRCLTHYATFSGRARRSEYWWFVAFVAAGSIACFLVDLLVFGVEASGWTFAPFLTVFQLAMAVPLLSAGWRRLHDVGRPGWLYLAPLVVAVIVAALELLAGLAGVGTTNGEAAGDGLPSTPVTQTISFVGFVAQLVATGTLLWFLTRPSETLPNDYGLAPMRI